MSEIKKDASLVEVASIVSNALRTAGIAATLSGGGAVSIYTNNEYQSKDLDFVTAAMLKDLAPVLNDLGFVHTGGSRLSQFEHPLVEWYVEFQASPLTFGHLQVNHEDFAVIKSEAGELRIVTPTQCVMDRLAAVFAWNDVQSRDQAIRVAANQIVDWEVLRTWFANEGIPNSEFEHFQSASRSNQSHRSVRQSSKRKR